MKKEDACIKADKFLCELKTLLKKYNTTIGTYEMEHELEIDFDDQFFTVGTCLDTSSYLRERK